MGGIRVSEARGDDERFGSLYDAHRVALAAYCQRRLPADVVDDVIAEVFLTAWRRIDELPEGSALPWLLGVARNVVANQRRSFTRRRRLSVRVLAHRSDPELSVDPMAGDRRVLDALAALSASDQEVLRLRAWEELTSAEIAVVLGITPAAVDMRLSRAKRRFEHSLISVGFTAGGVSPRVAEEGLS